MQMMMSTSTHGIFLSLDEMSRFLDVPKDALAEVLQPKLTSSIEDHEMFLKTFGIFRDRHFGLPCWKLLGRGHLFTLGYDVRSSLLGATHQVTFW